MLAANRHAHRQSLVFLLLSSYNSYRQRIDWRCRASERFVELKTHIEVVQLQLSQSVVQRLLNVLGPVLVVPQLGGDKDIFALQTGNFSVGTLNALANLLLVAVNFGQVKVAVAGLERLVNAIADLSRGGLPGTVSNTRDGVAGIELDGLAERHCAEVFTMSWADCKVSGVGREVVDATDAAKERDSNHLNEGKEGRHQVDTKIHQYAYNWRAGPFYRRCWWRSLCGHEKRHLVLFWVQGSMRYVTSLEDEASLCPLMRIMNSSGVGNNVNSGCIDMLSPLALGLEKQRIEFGSEVRQVTHLRVMCVGGSRFDSPRDPALANVLMTLCGNHLHHDKIGSMR